MKPDGSKLTVQNFLVDNTGHVKLTDFGLATGALNPQKIESMKMKVSFRISESIAHP